MKETYGPDFHDLPTEGGWRQKVPVRHIDFEDEKTDEKEAAEPLTARQPP